jgi:hypothetical protein
MGYLCKCATYAPCPRCGDAGAQTYAEQIERSKLTAPATFWVTPEPVATYTAPDPPKQLVPADVLLPGLALTKAARIARRYKQRGGVR